MRVRNITERFANDEQDVKRNIIKDRGYQVAVMFDLDGTLHHNEAKWKIKPNMMDELNTYFPLTKEEEQTLRMTQERGAESIQALKKQGITDMGKIFGGYFDMAEFGDKGEYQKQVEKGEPINRTLTYLKKHLTHGHKAYILTARSGKARDLADTFGKELDKIVGLGPQFTKRGAVYTINMPKFGQFWKTLGIHSSADKKAAIIQSYLKYKPGMEPFEDNPNKELFHEWRRNHEDKLVDKAYFYDDEMTNILAVQKMLEREQDKLLHGADSVVIHYIKPDDIKEMKNAEANLKMIGYSKRQIIKEMNEQDEVISLKMSDKTYSDGRAYLKRKAFIQMYKDMDKDKLERKLEKKFKHEIVEMANVFGLPRTNNREGLTEMIYEKLQELNEMARAGEYIKVGGKTIEITKGNRGMGSNVEAGGKTYTLTDKVGKEQGDKKVYSAKPAEAKADTKVADKAKADKKSKVKETGKVAIPEKYRPGAFVSAFAGALKNNKVKGVSEKGKTDEFSVESADKFLARFGEGLKKQGDKLKFKDALTKLHSVASAISKIHNGTALSAEEKSNLDSTVRGATLKSGKKMTFSDYLLALKKKGKEDMFHSKLKERLAKVIDKKSGDAEKELSGSMERKNKKEVDEELVIMNGNASRMYDKLCEASMYEGGVKMFLESVIENTPSEEKDDLYKDIKIAFAGLAIEHPGYADLLEV